MKGTQYLITGATGNLGSTVAGQLVAEGKDVRALVYKNDPAADRLPKDAEIIVGDKCVERKVGKLVYMSSTSAIPEFPGRRTIEEVSSFDPAGVVACCDKGRKDEGYIMANDCVSVRKMFRLLSSLSGAKKVKVIVPAPLAKAPP